MATAVTTLAVISLVLGTASFLAAAIWWQKNRSPVAHRIRRRLDQSTIPIATSPLSIESMHRAAEHPSSTSISILDNLLRYLAAAGLHTSPAKLALACLAYLTIIMIAMGALPTSRLLAAILGVVLLLLPTLYVRRRYAKTAARYDRQLPEALDVMARSLQAGKSIVGCWREMSDVLPAPMGPVCHEIFLKMTYGGELDEILKDTAARIPSEDMRFFFTALTIQAKSGGNLVTLLRNQADLMRERLALKERIRALSSESRMSAWIMGLMPFAVTGLMFLLSPKTMTLLWSTPTGMRMIEFGLLMQLLGALWIWRLIQIKV